MANGANRLFDVIKQTSESTNTVPSQIISLAVKSIQPLIFIRDDRLEITEEFCIFSKLVKKENLNVGDIVTAMVFNEGQNYFIVQDSNEIDFGTDNYNILSNKPKLNGIELIGDKSSDDLSLVSKEYFQEVKTQLENKINEKNIITAGLNSDFTVTSTAEYQTFNIPVTKQIFKIGDKLTINNGKIVIGEGVSKVLVSANCVSRGDLNTIGLIISKNEGEGAQTYNIPGSATFFSLTLTPIGMDVEEGDIIGLYYYINNSGNSRLIWSYNGYGTYLTVQVIK